MKKFVLKTAIPLMIAAAFSACGNSAGNAVEQARQAQAAIQQNTPGSIAVSENGYAMRAKINGKEWNAASMMPPDATARIIGNNNGESISLPLYGGRAKLVQGRKTTFSEDEAVDLMTNDDVGIWGGYKGEMEVTKVNENFAEGRFYFTASSSRSPKTVEVTEGYFRIPLSRN